MMNKKVNRLVERMIGEAKAAEQINEIERKKKEAFLKSRGYTSDVLNRMSDNRINELIQKHK